LAWWNEQYLLGNKPNKKKALEYYKSLKQEFIFINDVSSRVSRNSVDDVEIAFRNFFSKRTKHPQFKKKGIRDSFSIREKEKFSVKGRELRIEKFGSLIRMRNTLRFVGLPKQITVSKSGGKWFVSVLVDTQIQTTQKRKPSCVGVDLGISTLATLSSGLKFVNDRVLTRQLKNLKNLQRRLSRKIRGSNNYKKLRLKISKLHYYIKCKRQAILHEITTYLCKSYSAIVIEDLNVSGMVKNRKLSRAISEIGFYEFRRQLEYKSEIYNNELIIAGRFFPSSKTCSKCGHVNKKLSLSDRTFICPECGLKIDRDINAAINLKQYYSLDRFEPDYNRLEEFSKTAVPCSLNVDARNFIN
jgi:putative transposase